MALGGALPPVIAILTADISEFSAKMGEAGAEIAGLAADGKTGFAQFASLGKAALFGVAAAAAVIAPITIDMASKFDAAMERLVTQAGVPQAALKGLENSVLNLAGTVATNPDSLAAALYHIESSFASTGITAAKAMSLLQIAAEGAKVGGADLVDVTNALDAAVVSGIPGVQNYSQAMGALNAIVGSGDMTMQDLADAMGTGVAASAKVFGLSLSDVGAALATFGDNNIRGAKAGTDLKMVMQDLGKQGAPGVAALQSIGIASGQLARDMETGGLNKAMVDLHNHLVATGNDGATMGQILEDAFTKKGGVGIAILMSQFDRLESKYPDIDKGAATFGQSWQATTQQFQFKVQALEAQVEALGIRLGNWLIPIVTRMAGAISNAVTWFEKHAAVAKALGVAIGTVLVAAIVAYIGATTIAAAETLAAMAPFIALAAVIGGLGVLIYELTTNWNGTVAAIKKVVEQHKLLAVAIGIVLAPLAIIIGPIVAVTYAISHWGDITRWFSDLWNEVWGDVTAPFVSAVADIEDGVTGIIDFFTDMWTGFETGVTDGITMVLGFFTSLPGKILQGIEALPGMLAAAAQRAILDFAYGLGFGAGLIWDFFTQLVPEAVSFVIGLGPKLLDVAVSAIGDMVSGLVSAAVDVWTFFTELPGKVLNFLEALPDKLGGLAKRAFYAFAVATATGFETVLQFVESIPQRILNALVSLGRLLITTGSNLIGGLWSGIKSAWNAVTNWFTSLPTTVENYFIGAISWLYDIGVKVIEGFINGLKHGASGVIGWVKSFAGGVKGAFKDGFDMASPSKMTMEIGDQVIQGLVVGMAAASGRAVAAAKAVSKATIDGFGGTGKINVGLGAIPTLPSLSGSATLTALLGAAGTAASSSSQGLPPLSGTFVLQVNGQQFAEGIFPDMRTVFLQKKRQLVTLGFK